GYAVALAGDLLAVGAPRQVNAYGGANAPGYVDLFGRSGAQWVPGGSLQAPDGTAADEFGFAVSMADGRLAVGAPRADQGIEFDAGAVYVFRDDGGTWSEEAELTAPLPAQHAQFGVSVELGDAIAVVGAGDEDPFSGTRGGAYVYGRTGSTWMLLGE